MGQGGTAGTAVGAASGVQEKPTASTGAKDSALVFGRGMCGQEALLQSRTLAPPLNVNRRVGHLPHQP